LLKSSGDRLNVSIMPQEKRIPKIFI